MTKYKLIKTYPKSPPLGTIVEIGTDGYLTYRMRNDYNQEMTSIHKSVLTEYSEFWEKVAEKPLFTTEDGVDIFDPNQKVFSVSECDFKLQDHQDYGWIMTRSIERKYHHFSTKKAAEEYIIRNKPCLSLNDIAKIYKTANISISEYTSKKDKNQNHDQGVKLIDLVKEKLKF